MDRYALKLNGATGALVADTTKLVTGPSRGANRFLKPAKGPSCVPKA